MLFSAIPQLSKRKHADLLVVPFWEGVRKPKAAAPVAALKLPRNGPIEMGDFKGKEGETLLLYTSGAQEKRVLLLGLGKEEALNMEGLRRAYCVVAKEGQKRGIDSANVLVPNIAELRNLTVEQALCGIAEGILLANYCWNQLSTLQEETVLLKSVTLIGILPKDLSVVKKQEQIAEGVYFARDLINGNADVITPQYLVSIARKLARKFPTIKSTLMDRKQIEQEKLGLLTAVGRGSANGPAFIILKYQGHPKSKDHTILVGKGVTYDTGGLQIKTGSGMLTMRDDMSGAATVLGVVATAAAMRLKQNVTAVIPTTENAVDANSFKPGDVYKAYNGTTVEVIDTDAEGRLILADALAYAVKKLKPTRLIDLATLTGSMVVALGEEISGFFCNDETLAEKLSEASDATHELLWRLPLHAAYKESLRSDIADIKNVGGRSAGALKAALFLEAFVGDKVAWAHLDIAGTAFAPKEQHYWPKNGVGFGVRLLLDFLQKLK